MRVAIIGANGQLGTDLVKVFGEDPSFEVIPLTHRDLDVTVPETLKVLKELKPDVIINTAAYVRVDDAEIYPEKAFAVNTIGALNVARVASEIDAINVYISTDYVFDGEKGEPYTEDDVPNPINVYGASKYSGEIFTRNYSTKYYIIRVASLYGKAGASGKGGNFVNWVIEKAKRGEELRIVDDQFMSPTYTMDVARTLKKFLEVGPEWGVYHMVNEGYCSWYEFTKTIFEILGWDVEVKPIKSSELNRLARRPMFSALRNEKLERIELRMMDWEEALREYLRR
ncbi:dTDP-4-dehydrorhamnose reductase [Thermococcus sp. GR7]|uniref:dTDP-4-dehydrorhamnose reductase n=1 Tax=unclassified Thermococcus TaxID=2627626 RepID=UPI00142FDFD5|nr:dTDP-4-dehydrorhamnose reductase [Thermococcus sp. GR7]NJE78804.1 dTDP-4-dehydrorhamnose reductase [Thermococcus sp. GR4]NJF22108.1 dTDP-4-dehydrorhamnose reductase [Thermococcus sp. GR5]